MTKAKFIRASNHCNRVLETAKLAYVNKAKETITSQKLNCRDFWRIVNSVLNNVKSTVPPLFHDSDVLSFTLDKTKIFLNY